MSEMYKAYKKMIERKPDPGFHKLDGYNAPKINYFMIVDFITKNPDRQIAKALRQEYLDEDIDFVQIKTSPTRTTVSLAFFPAV